MRIRLALAAAVAATMTVTPGALAAGEISDPCGPEGLAEASTSYPYDPTLPWYDLCGGDVAAVASDAGPAWAIEATLRLAGDTSLRRDSAIYALTLATEHCGYQVQHVDAGVGTAGATRLVGSCNNFVESCPVPVVGINCVFAGDDVAVTGSPAVTATVAGDSIALRFDPNLLDDDSVPPEIVSDLAVGAVVRTGALTWLKAEVSADGFSTLVANPMDEATGSDVVLGG